MYDQLYEAADSISTSTGSATSTVNATGTPDVPAQLAQNEPKGRLMPSQLLVASDHLAQLLDRAMTGNLAITDQDYDPLYNLSSC